MSLDALTVLNRILSPTVENCMRDAGQLMALNDQTAAWGLTLTQEEAAQVAVCRTKALHLNERIEVGLGALEKLTAVFAASGYVERSDWAELLCRVTEMFYQYKTDMEDRISDTELIAYLFYCFELECGGDPDLTEERLDELCRGENNGGFSFDEEDGEDGADGWERSPERSRGLIEDLLNAYRTVKEGVHWPVSTTEIVCQLTAILRASGGSTEYLARAADELTAYLNEKGADENE